MRTTLVLTVGATLVLSLVAFVPTTGAQTHCAFDVWTFSADYDCHVAGVGGSGELRWCPDPFVCFSTHVIGCDLVYGVCWL